MNKYGITGTYSGQVSLTSFDGIVPSGKDEECSPLFSVQVIDFPYVENARNIYGKRVATFIPGFFSKASQESDQYYSAFSGKLFDALSGKKVTCRNAWLRETCGVDILEYVVGDYMDYSSYAAPERLKFRNTETGQEGYAPYTIELIDNNGTMRVVPVNEKGIPQTDPKYCLIQYPDAPIGILLPLITHNTNRRSRALVG